MVFGFNKNKREVVDLRLKDSGGIPSSGYLKRKNTNVNGTSSSVVSPTITSTADYSSAQTSNSSAESSGNSGFFGFFGNNENNNSASSSNTASSSYGGYGNSNNSSTDISKVDEKLNDLLYRFSRLMDRVELLEKKMDRLDRRNSSEGM